MNSKHTNNTGFTVVELLIVIVVIAILAAITIVSYNGISKQAKQSAAQTAVEQAAKKIALYAVENGELPPSSLGVIGLNDSDSTSYQYRTYDSGKKYCVTATASSISYYIDNDTHPSPTAGACDGHGVDGGVAITNLVINPSFESSTVSWSTANDASMSRSNQNSVFGSYSIQVSTSSTVDSGIGITLPGLTGGDIYTASATVKASTTGIYSVSVQGAAGASGAARTTKTITAGQTARIDFTWTAAASGNAVFYILKNGTGNPAGTYTYNVDGAMATKGSTVYGFADGNSPGWIWNGTTNNSTSTGPAPQ